MLFGFVVFVVDGFFDVGCHGGLVWGAIDSCDRGGNGSRSSASGQVHEQLGTGLAPLPTPLAPSRLELSGRYRRRRQRRRRPLSQRHRGMILGLKDVQGRSDGSVGRGVGAVSSLMSHELRQTLGLVTTNLTRQVRGLVHFGFEFVEKRSGLALRRRGGAATAGAATARSPVRRGPGCDGDAAGGGDVGQAGGGGVERSRRAIRVVDDGREIAESALTRRQTIVVVRGGADRGVFLRRTKTDNRRYSPLL